MIGEFIGAAALGGIIREKQRNHADSFFFANDEWIATPMLADMNTNEEDSCPSMRPSYMTPWWPGGGGALIADEGLYDYGECEWSDPYPVSGCNGRFSVAGYARDQYGSALTSAVVMLVRTQTGTPAIQSVVTSDPVTGWYTATSPYNDAHVLVLYTASIGGCTPAAVYPQ